MISLLYTCNPHRILAMWIQAWEGDLATHVGVWLHRPGVVIDASPLRGVTSTPHADWLRGRRLVDAIDVPADQMRTAEAEQALLACVGQGYDWAEMLGFPLLRNLGRDDRYVCSTLARLAVEIATGRFHPGRRGRWGVRLSRVDAAAYRDGSYLRGEKPQNVNPQSDLP